MATPTHTSRFTFDSDDTSVHLPSDVEVHTIVMVNVVFVGEPGAAEWVLVDAGLGGSAPYILAAAKKRYGDTPPSAIVLTHGHFDHVGALHGLIAAWPGVPIYVHALERPYLDGRASYPPPDPTVGGGLMARLSPLYPKGPYDFGDRLRTLPDDVSIPYMPGWRWTFTPGHSPGHVALFREADRTLIAGDAFVTQEQESLVGVITKKRVLRGPPMYFTPDWGSARASVQRLADLHPHLAITGHGKPMANPRLDHDLDQLVREFDRRAMPPAGCRYVDEPAVTDLDGVVSVPPKPTDMVPVVAAIGAITLIGVGAFLLANRSQEEPRVRSFADFLRG